MNVKAKRLPESKIELEVELDGQEFEKSFDQAIAKFQNDVNIAGFRKGKAPKEIILKEAGLQNVLAEAAKIAIEHGYKKAVAQENLEPISQPNIEVLKLAYKNPFVFKAVFFVLPDVELPDYKKIVSKIKRKQVLVSDLEVKESLDWLQESRPVLKQVFRAAKKGDFVEIEFSSPQIDNNKVQKDGFILGKGHLVPGFEDYLEGMEAGQIKEFSLKFPEKHFKPKLSGKEVNFKAEMKKVQETEVREINDGFAKSLGDFEGLDALRESIKSGIKEEKERAESQRIREEMLKAIEKECQVQVPGIVVETEKNRMLEHAKKFAQERFNLSFEDYLKEIKKTEQEFLEDLEKESEKRTRNFLVLREIAKKENIEISEEEAGQEVNKILSQCPDEKKARQSIDLEKLRDYTKERIRNEKTLQFLENLVYHQD